LTGGVRLPMFPAAQPRQSAGENGEKAVESLGYQ
jgi:hypothetical protein